MPTRDAFSRGLALAGTALVWFPFAAMLLTARLFVPRPRIDYLMPAELFPMVIVGAIVLLWAASRVRARIGMVTWGLAIVIGMFVAVSAIATMTGLASGAATPASAPGAWWAIIGALVAYELAVVELGVAGILLTRDTFSPVGGAPVAQGSSMPTSGDSISASKSPVPASDPDEDLADVR